MLENKLKEAVCENYPFHMPGHKRQKEWLDGLYDIDVTELGSTDDLHAPQGIIAHAQQRAARLFGTKNTIFLTGGSTCGILSAISAVCGRGDSIIIGRNCHRSVYNACLVNELKVSYIYPSPVCELGCFGRVEPGQVAEALEQTAAKVVVITSPTYEGIISDIKAIAETVHRQDGILIVDAAHGAHLGFNEYFPQSARHQGADIVIESAHKTLPCLTGAAMLHICSDKIDYDSIQEQLGIFETSSPSYPIMCSIDRFVSRAQQKDLFTPYVKRLEDFYTATKGFRRLSVYRTDDPSKLVISTKNADLSGFELERILSAQHSIDLEMAMPYYAIAMTSPADTDAGFKKLFKALNILDKIPPREKPQPLFPPRVEARQRLCLPGQTRYRSLPLKECVGRTSAEFIYAYPPGSPIIAPGEVFSKEIIDYIDHLFSTGAQIHSTKGKFPDFACVLAEND